VSGSRLAPCEPPRSSSSAAPVYDDDRRGLPLRSTPVHHTHAAAARAGGKWTPAPSSCPALTAPSPARSTTAGARRPGPAPAGGPPRCSCSVRSPHSSLVAGMQNRSLAAHIDASLTNREVTLDRSMKGWR
jgi:hypothetical protein